MSKFKKLFLTVLVCIFLLITIVPRVKTIVELSERKAELEKEKHLLVEKNKILQKRFEEAESLENIEKIAREQLGMVKKGEQFIMPVVSNSK